ncbi:transposase [Micromonospora sp. NPDC048063]|uniref:transposase n=1 Tax=Micromonospora sp. NPDC048063 TaxID=3364256 RepID=UPI00371A9075
MSIPPMIMPVVIVLRRWKGLSDRAAVDRLTVDVRWKYAAGGLDSVAVRPGRFRRASPRPR